MVASDGWFGRNMDNIEMPLSPEDVRNAWRILTDEPVPEDGLLAQMCALPSLTDFRRIVMQTHAFQLQLPRAVAKVPLSAPPLYVEVATDPATEAALLALVREKWLRMGKERPHWSVTGRDEHLPDHLAMNVAGFEASGQEDLNMVLAMLARNGLPADLFAHVCDFGCGVGRVSFPMARRFLRVTGCDVSEAHLRIAREEAARLGTGHLDFVLVEPPLFGMTEPFDLWFSHLVLQHNPPPVMAAILRRMFGLLSPGGVALFQVPTYIRGYRYDSASYLRAPPADLMEVHVLPQQEILTLARNARCEVLEIREDCSVWPPSEAVSSMMLFRKRFVA